MTSDTDNAVVAIYDNHDSAESAVKKLAEPTSP